MRHDPELIADASARARIARRGTEGSHARIAGRRAAELPAAEGLHALPSGLVRLLADVDATARAFRLAAAAVHGAEIAQAVSAEARAAMADLVDREMRAFAVRHRKAGRLQARPLAEEFPATLLRVARALAERLPEATAARLALPGPDIAATDADRRCLDLALRELLA